VNRSCRMDVSVSGVASAASLQVFISYTPSRFGIPLTSRFIHFSQYSAPLNSVSTMCTNLFLISTKESYSLAGNKILEIICGWDTL